MTPPRIANSVRLRMVVAVVLVATGLLAQAAGLKSGQPSSPAAAASVAPVERLIIQYKAGAQPRSTSVVSAAARDAQAAAAALVSQSAVQALAPGLRYLKSVSPRLHVARLDRALPAADAEALLQRLRADPAVQSVVIDRRVQRHALPTDPYFTGSGFYYQWHLQSSASVPGGINAAGAWGSSSGTGVVVAVLDGGYQPHPDLTANLLTANDYDFIADLWTANDGNQRDVDAQDPGDWVSATDPNKPAECSAEDSSWHGTHVAGLIGALANGSEGVGVAYGAKVLPVRVLGRCGGYLSDILDGMRWAAGLSTVSGVTLPVPRPKVLNLSLGVDDVCDAGTQSVVDEIRAQGVAIVASTGNEGLIAITKPANCMGVVAVTAHARSGVSADYANVGPEVGISAPGGDASNPVVSTWNTGVTVPGSPVYGGMYGTSMAAPQVAGVLALMASAVPVRDDLSMPTLVALMRGASRPFPNGSYCFNNPGFCGSGLLDAGAAVTAAAAAPLDAPDLDVLQRLDEGKLALGERVDFSVHVRNWGATAATGVQVTASVTGMDIQSVTTGTAGVVPTHSTTGLSAAAGDLAAGAELVLNVTAWVTAADGYVTSGAHATSTTLEATTVNNDHLLVPTSVPPDTVVSDGGGGCTVAPGGQTDAGLPLLLLATLLAGIWRRRARR